MELKRLTSPYSDHATTRFNRTFMELKLFNLFSVVNNLFGFNRTFMELKRLSELQAD